MADSRFFDIASPLSGKTVLELTGGCVIGGTRSDTHDQVLIDAVASLDSSSNDKACVFIAEKSMLSKLSHSEFGLCLLSENLCSKVDPEIEQCVQLLVSVPNAQLAFIQVINTLYTEKTNYYEARKVGIDASASHEVNIHPSAILSQGVEIGKRTRIGPNVVIGPGVKIGRDCDIGANVTIAHTIMDDFVTVLAGAAIGQAGFGFVPAKGGLIRMPQLGQVLIHDNVEIGANTTIDRGTLSDTIIGKGTRIDNQVQIAHNVILGENCILAAHTGISGSCIVGNNVMFGGRAGLADHLHIGDGARIAANAGCMKDIPAGETWAGSPAMPIRRYMREVTTLAKLADPKKKKDQN